MNNQDQQVVNDIKNSKSGKFLGGIFSSINRRTIVDIIVVLIPLILIYIYFTGLSLPKDVKDALEDNKKIDVKIDSLRMSNEYIKNKISDLESKEAMYLELIQKNNELIQQNNNELTKLKKDYNEKINNVKRYNVRQLDSFFTKRYKEYYR